MFAPCSSKSRACSRRKADRFCTTEMDACDEVFDSFDLLALEHSTLAFA